MFADFVELNTGIDGYKVINRASVMHFAKCDSWATTGTTTNCSLRIRGIYDTVQIEWSIINFASPELCDIAYKLLLYGK